MLRAFLILTLLSASHAMAASSPVGLWMTQKQGVVVDVYECDGGLCGKTVWLKKMTFKNGAPRLDAKNPDPALRDRHWCGIEVIRAVKPAGPGKWEGGEIYDPKTGSTFSFNIAQKGEKLKVRGYVGTPILGKSETWTRADAAGLELCKG